VLWLDLENYFTRTFYRTIPSIAHVVSYSWLYAGRRICLSDFIGANKHPPIWALFILTYLFLFSQLMSGDHVSYLFCRNESFVLLEKQMERNETGLSIELCHHINITFHNQYYLPSSPLQQKQFWRIIFGSKTSINQHCKQETVKYFYFSVSKQMTSIGL